MSSRTVKYVCLAVGFLLVTVVILKVRRDSALDRRFDEARLIGLSTGEVQRLVGAPEFVVESNTWLYFLGGTPVATLIFREGRLETVERSSW